MESNINTPKDINDAEKPLKLNGTTSGRVDINVLKSKLQETESKEFKKNIPVGYTESSYSQLPSEITGKGTFLVEI